MISNVMHKKRWAKGLAGRDSLEKGITNRQMFFILILVIAAFRTTDIPQLAAKSMGRSGWIMILLYAVPYSLVALMLAKLNSMFGGMTLYEYGPILLGKVLSNIFCILLFVYLFSVLVFLNHNMSNIITMNFLPKTKPIFTLAAATALFGFVVYKGTDTIARLLELFGLLYVLATLILCLLMLTQSEIANIHPLYSPGEGANFASSLLKFGAIYGGMENLLLIPFTKRNQGAPKVAFFSIICVGILFVLVTEGTIGLIGVNNATVYNDAFIEAIKLAEAPVIERMDIFYFTFGLTTLFSSLIIIIHTLVEILLKVLPMAKRWLVVALVCAASYAAALIVMMIPEYDLAVQPIRSVLGLVFAGVVPTLLFLLAKWKKRLSKG